VQVLVVQYRFSVTDKTLHRWFKSYEKASLVTKMPEVERDVEPSVYLISDLSDSFEKERASQVPQPKL